MGLCVKLILAERGGYAETVFGTIRYRYTVVSHITTKDPVLTCVLFWWRFPCLEWWVGSRHEGLEVCLEPGTSLRGGLESIGLRDGSVRNDPQVRADIALTREHVES